MSEVEGTETISQLLGIAESVVFDFTSLFEEEGDLKATPIGEGIQEYVEYLIENPGDITGISTGFPEFDAAIGGGLLPGVTIVGARAKVGKTTLSVNVAKNIGEQNIPVLYLDTEMVETGKYRDISLKMLSMISDVDINDIKSGAISDDPVKQRKVREAAEWIKEHDNITRIGIAGKPFEDQLYAIRRWIQSNVGLNEDGTAKDCVIIYDYLKLMDGAGVNEAMREFQMLGMMMTALQNLAVRYAVPILSFTQLNRDGLDGEHAGVVAGSDRITWFCTAFCIFKYKSPDEIAEDGPEMGNRKIVVVLSRYGPGHDFGEYCNFAMNKYKAQIVEVDDNGANVVGDFFEVMREDDDDNDEEMEIPFG
jgi:replicative DNA helicase